MARNVYDQAHLLASSLKESPEYAEYLLALTGLKSQKQTLGIFRDFRKRQFQFQSRLLQGEEIPEEERERFRRLSELIADHGPISAFLAAEYRLSRLLGDIQKIIADAVELSLDDGEEEAAEESRGEAEEQKGERGAEQAGAKAAAKPAPKAAAKPVQEPEGKTT